MSDTPSLTRKRNIVIACCRDEEDLIADFIDFYCDAGFDAICLIDNGSRDKTIERIFSHPQRERIRLLVDTRIGYDARLLEYYRHFVADGDGWVFFVDVDEFIMIPQGIRAYAAGLPDRVNCLRLPVVEMFADSTADHPLLTRRREVRFQRETKMVWRNNAAVDTIYTGKHDLNIQPRHEHLDEQVYIRHYHTRSRSQFRRKIENRVQTEESFSDAQRSTFSIFSLEQQSQWLDHSRSLLETEGWVTECGRVDSAAYVDDGVVHDWYLAHRERSAELHASSIVKLSLRELEWQCFAVGQCDETEGHTSREHLVLVHAPHATLTRWNDPIFAEMTDVYTRIHSECLFGDVFDGDTCDCGWQLSDSFAQIAERGMGVIVYLRQEGRGIGLLNKINSMSVPHHDSFIRNEEIGQPADSRGYRLAGIILRGLGVKSAHLGSGNPHKLAALRTSGIRVHRVDSALPPALSREARLEVAAKIRRGYTYTGMEVTTHDH